MSPHLIAIAAASGIVGGLLGSLIVAAIRAHFFWWKS